jgi:hypothetical protein
MFGSDSETPRNDASRGLFLKGDGSGGVTPVSAGESGLNIGGEVRELCMIHAGKNRIPAIIVAKNNSLIQIIKIGDNRAEP